MSDTLVRNRYADVARNPDHTIDQLWGSYTDEEHDRWRRLIERSGALLQGRACNEYLEGAQALQLPSGRIPDMAVLSDRLQAMTGWRVVPVAGLVPDEVFFEHLANRRFPAGAFIRPESEMDYLEEPDIFHDIFGHVPLLTNPTYAAFIQAYGEGGQRAMALGMLPNLARLYWYTVEFGLINSGAGLRIFGAGIMSSVAECVYCLESAVPTRIVFDLERVMRTEYSIDDFQKTYFVIDSFDALLEQCYQDFSALYLRLGHLPTIAPGDVIDGDIVIMSGARG